MKNCLNGKWECEYVSQCEYFPFCEGCDYYNCCDACDKYMDCSYYQYGVEE